MNVKGWMVGWLLAGLGVHVFRYFYYINSTEWMNSSRLLPGLAITILPPFIGYCYYRFKNGWKKRKGKDD